MNGTEDRLHVKFIYGNAILSTVLAAAAAGITGWITEGSVIFIALSAFAAIAAVYLISYIVFSEISRSG
ncbi:hypothetical protein [Corynebacterium variabile]|uniref:hypothetical protein n=1 Tax=Corynebacterium variabile TaxID=1727 RepID=UPI00114302D3|nr:hypothetical protein [Corynebacterium variabile]